MRLVMTMMVRDEADIVGAMIEHSLAQGIDHLIVTDNGSIDGTVEILEHWRSMGLLDLRHEPVQLKQQSPVVTGMARDAATLHGADWVINADADEFWVPVTRDRTVRDALASIPVELGSFTADVVDMIGAPAERGSGLHRLRYRDARSVAALNEVGIHAHSTPDAVHVGDPSVSVAQGNHTVSIDSAGQPPPELELEVLHLQWRSWAQFERKVSNAGRAYDANPGLEPSPNHHGMRDWRRAQAGTLWAWYLARHPDRAAVAAGLLDGTYRADDALDALSDPVAEVGIDDAIVTRVGAAIRETVATERRVAEVGRELAESERTRSDLVGDLAGVTRDLERARSRRAVRLADGLRRVIHR